MVITKYKNDGWGLSAKEFELLYQFLKSNSKPLNVVEFGSGRSTEFLVDVMTETGNQLNIYSFDDSKEYAFSGTHPNLKLNIVPLVECSDTNFELMFNDKKYQEGNFTLKTTPVHTRQRNTFYKIDDEMLPEKIDLMILDGPHGNGRSIGFLRCVDRLKEGSVVLIDDASHYPFFENLKRLKNVEIQYEQHNRDNKWYGGGDFVLCKILK